MAAFGDPAPIEPEAPTADQPEAPEAPVTDAPEAPEAGTSTETPAAPETETPESDEESFTDVKVDDLPEDVQSRYGQMQADYTRKTQALAERHQELDTAVSFVSDLVSDEQNATQEAVFRTLAERLGYDLDDDGDLEGEPDTEPLDDETPEQAEFRDSRLDPILAEREAKAETERQAAYEQQLDETETHIENGIKALAKADGIDLTEEELGVVFDSVLALPPQGDGPNVKAAYDRYKAATKAHTDRWVQSKKTTQAPTGQAGEEPVDFSNEEARLALTARHAEAAMRAQSGL